MSLISKVKAGLRRPGRAISYLWHGEEKYNLIQAENLEQSVRPENNLEAHMIKRTDIHEHLATLNMLTIELGLKTVLELGTGKGESTVALLEAVKRTGGRVYSLDIDPCEEAHVKIKAYKLDKYWTFIQGDSLKIDWRRRIDHLFIDTYHTFDHTLEELKKYEPYVRRGGIVTLHDIVTWPGVLQAAKKYAEKRPGLRLYKYFNNNGLAIIYKGRKNLA